MAPDPRRSSTPLNHQASGEEQVLNAAVGMEARRPKLNLPWPRVPKRTDATHFPTPNHAGGSPSPIKDESVPLPGRSISVVQLHDALQKELVANTLNINSNLVERLLPRERLPFPVNEDLLRKLSAPIGINPPIWNELESSFYHLPMDFSEAAVCEWLNNIGTTMGLAFGRQCERLWWSGSCGEPLVDSSVHRQPDVILLDHNYHDRVSRKVVPGPKWAFVKALAVVHQRPNAQLTDMINVRSYLTFLCQPHRRFTISLLFIKKGQFSITVTDRAGQVRIDLMEPSRDSALLLLWILAFLMFGRLEEIGLDPHFEIDPSNGQIVAIECDNRRFEVVERIHVLHSLFGRGTQVWIVIHNGIKYIMKDSWGREDGLHNEVAHLRRMTTYKELKDRVPTLICGGDVVINGIKDSTQRYRSACYSHRVHRRIVTYPIGESIISFKSKKEFIRVMMSIIETHRYLYDHLKILHCDLSINNILLNRKDDSSEPTGLLIDYDCSIDSDSEAHASNTHLIGERVVAASNAEALDGVQGCGAVGDRKVWRETPRTGTPPYMAIEALLGSNTTFIHKPQHDLESILYIILYICTFVWGPGLPLYKLDIPPATLPLRTWFNKDRTKEIGHRKLAHLQCYDIAILPNFTPYWRDFAPFVKDLILACFPVNARLPSELRYERALRILEKASNSVTEPTNQASLAFNRVSRIIRPHRDLKRPNSSLSHRDIKKGKYSLHLS